MFFSFCSTLLSNINKIPISKITQLLKFFSSKKFKKKQRTKSINSATWSRKPNFIFLEAPAIINAHKHRKDLKDDFFKEDSQLTLFSIFHFIQIKYPKIASIWTIFLDLITGKSSHFIFYRKSWWAAVFRVYTDLPTSGFLWNKLAFFLNTKSYLSLTSFPPIRSSTYKRLKMKIAAKAEQIPVLSLSLIFLLLKYDVYTYIEDNPP